MDQIHTGYTCFKCIKLKVCQLSTPTDTKHPFFYQLFSCDSAQPQQIPCTPRRTDTPDPATGDGQIFSATREIWGLAEAFAFRKPLENT